MSLDAVIKIIALVVTVCGYGYYQQLRTERVEAKLDAVSAQLVRVEARLDKQAEDIDAWKRATVDVIFKKRGGGTP